LSADQHRLRASDADREAAAQSLRAHCAAGRLDVAELEDRLAAALSARTLGELAVLSADLPSDHGVSPPAQPPVEIHVGLPGVRHFHQTHVLEVSQQRAFSQANVLVLPQMVGAGWSIVARTEPELLVLELSSLPAWVPFVCVFAFPIGLLALTARRTERVVISFESTGPGQSKLRVSGVARRSVRKAFAELSMG